MIFHSSQSRYCTQKSFISILDLALGKSSFCMNFKENLQIPCIRFHFAVIKFNILQYQCIFYWLHKQQAKIPRSFLGSLFARLASLTSIFFEIRQVDPKVLLKCFWAFVILTCSLSFSRSDRKERKLLSEVAFGAFKSPQGSPLFHKILKFFV